MPLVHLLSVPLKDVYRSSSSKRHVAPLLTSHMCQYFYSATVGFGLCLFAFNINRPGRRPH